LPGNGCYRRRFFSFSHWGSLVAAARAELLSTDTSTNLVPGWRPFLTSLLVLSPHARYQLPAEFSPSPTSYFTSLHSTELLTTPTDNWLVASNCPAYNIWARSTCKTQFPLLVPFSFEANFNFTDNSMTLLDCWVFCSEHLNNSTLYWNLI
jgi:hypothetical protein